MNTDELKYKLNDLMYLKKLTRCEMAKWIGFSQGYFCELMRNIPNWSRQTISRIDYFLRCNDSTYVSKTKPDLK